MQLHYLYSYHKNRSVPVVGMLRWHVGIHLNMRVARKTGSFSSFSLFPFFPFSLFPFSFFLLSSFFRFQVYFGINLVRQNKNSYFPIWNFNQKYYKLHAASRRFGQDSAKIRPRFGHESFWMNESHSSAGCPHTTDFAVYRISKRKGPFCSPNSENPIHS